jgi:malate dehydrogenase (oxaloacetate-decarboxylating)
VSGVKRARAINGLMKLAAAHAIADMIPEVHLMEDYIVPKVFEKRVVRAVAEGRARTRRSPGGMSAKCN